MRVHDVSCRAIGIDMEEKEHHSRGVDFGSLLNWTSTEEVLWIEEMNRNMRYFARNYDIISQHVLMDKENKPSIGTDDGYCRYCGRSIPDTTFAKAAHAVPELIGNKSLFSIDECDQCNEHFGRELEDHLAKYLGAMRTISQIKGKKRVPTYKDPEGVLRISLEAAGLQLSRYEDDPSILDIENKTVTIVAPRQSYIPMAVFKCFVKMAIAIAPDSTVKCMKHLTTWLRAGGHTYESFPYKPMIALEQFTPGYSPYRGVHLFLLQRRADSQPVPFLQFIVAFGNQMFQIVVPMPNEDKPIMNKTINVCYFPIPFADDYPFGKSSKHRLDLSSTDVERNNPLKVTMQFEAIEEMTKSKHSMHQTLDNGDRQLFRNGYSERQTNSASRRK